MKELFVWYDKYSVNNAELDNQHKALFNIFNRLYSYCLKNEVNTTLKPIISELVAYTVYHFSTEELYMRSTGYKNIENHISEHKIFTGKILQLQADNCLNEHGVSKELIVYLWDWITNHVLIEDKKIAFLPNRSI